MKALIFLSISAIFMSSAYAYTGFGVCNFGKETVDSVICYGPTVMKQTTVKGNIKVTGSLQAANILVRDMLIEGSADLLESQVSGAVKVVGALHANGVEFKQGVAVESNDIVLNKSKVNGLMTITSGQKNPYLQLQCGSVITGSVLFDGKAGVVQVTGDSLVKGKVINGSMEFVKRDCD